jgi:hypothetical protein
VLAVIDTFFVSISLTALGLLAIAVLPWVLHLVRSVEFPGGIKLEMRELERAERRLEEAGLLATAAVEEKPTFIEVKERDPNLALAGLRIEIEKRLRRIVGNARVQSSSLNHLINFLAQRKVLSWHQMAALNDLIPLLNRAAHGAEVPEDASDWAMSIGPLILGALDGVAEISGDVY